MTYLEFKKTVRSRILLSVMMKISFLVLLFSFVILSWVHADLFSSIYTVQPLLQTQDEMIYDVESYIFRENERLNVIIRHMKLFTENDRIIAEKPEYVGNHIRSFILIKKLTMDLNFAENTIAHKNEFKRNVDMTYPTDEDLGGTAATLAHLQNTYRLNITDLANGVLNAQFSRGKQRYTELFTPMSANDCYILGRLLYEQKYFKLCIVWMVEALAKYNGTKADMGFLLKQQIMEYIRYGYYSLGDIRNTLKWTKNMFLLKYKGADLEAHMNEIRHLEERLASGDLKIEQKNKEKTYNDIETEADFKSDAEREIFASLCRGEMNIPNEVSSRITCRYLTESHPFLTLARVKMEQLYIAPDIILFHDVIYDAEIEHLKDITKPRLERIKYRNVTEVGSSPNIIYKSTRLYDTESDIIARISRRISHFTGLDASHAEPYQVVNYGIAGYFTPHYDFSSFKKNITHGNTLATVLLYMSAVTQGGATVFPHLGLHVFPVKRAALFWRNLLQTGNGDLSTWHSGCPVLRGSKWLSTKWFLEHGQVFRKPCSLKNKENRIIHKKYPMRKRRSDLTLFRY